MTRLVQGDGAEGADATDMQQCPRPLGEGRLGWYRARRPAVGV